MSDSQTVLIAKLSSETAKIAWHELQRFFAQGIIVFVQKEEDLVSVAVKIVEDNKREVELLRQKSGISDVTNEQARQWYENNSLLWCVVVAPFVLVQEVGENID